MQKSLRCKDSRLGFGILILFGISLVIPKFRITRPFPAPGNNGDLRTNGIYGPKCSALSGNCTPLGCLEKMLLASSIWGSTRRFLTWSRQATPLGFSYFLLSPSAHGMSAKELSSSAMLLPTPLASDEGTEKVDYTVYIWYNVSIKYRRCFYDRTTAEIDAKSIHGNI